MRPPKVMNQYGLNPKDIEKAIVINSDRLSSNPFWRNENINAWCLSDDTAKTSGDYEFLTYNEYWIGFFDNGKIKLSCSAHGGMCNYHFDTFFDDEDIEHEMDLEIQEKLLERINWLIDEKIIEIKEKLI